MQKVRALMSRDVRVISPDETIKAAALHMINGNFGMLPVVENDRMIGAISDRDISIRAVAEGKDTAATVCDVMSDALIWAYEDDSVADATKLMTKH